MPFAIHGSLSVVVLLTILLGASCNLPTDELEFPPPHPATDRTITRLWFDQIVTRPPASGLILKADFPRDEQLGPNEYLPVTISTESGTEYEARLRWYCPFAESLALCVGIDLTLQANESVASLDALLHELDAKMFSGGHVQLFTGRAEQVIQKFQRHPSIKYAEPVALFTDASLNPALPPARVFVSTDPNLGPRNRTLIVSLGERVVASYTNLDGSVLTADIVYITSDLRRTGMVSQSIQ